MGGGGGGGDMQRSRMQSMTTWESPVSDKLLVKKLNKRLMMNQTLRSICIVFLDYLL